MQVERIAECTGSILHALGAICNTVDLHLAIMGLEKTNNLFVFFLSSLLRQVLLYIIKFNEYPI